MKFVGENIFEQNLNCGKKEDKTCSGLQGCCLDTKNGVVFWYLGRNPNLKERN